MALIEYLDYLAQIGIFVLGVSASYLSGSKTKRGRKWAGICGLAAEPCWLLTSWINGQPGIMALSLIYMYTWGRVYWNNRE